MRFLVVMCPTCALHMLASSIWRPGVGDTRRPRLSDRPLDERVRMLKELTEHVQTTYFAGRRRPMLMIASQERTKLRTKLDILEG
jgi:hypothetical protein